MKIISKSIKKSRLIFIFLSIIFMIIIFMFSSENGSDSQNTSGIITEFVAKSMVDDFKKLSESDKNDILDTISYLVRKTAHYSIYTSLGFCISCAFGRRKALSRKSLYSLLICFAYACSDEFHQYFVPERSCQLTDVLIDTSGALTGIVISLAVMFAFFRIKEKSKRLNLNN